MKVAILYICTGKYSGFWPTFFESAQKYLFTEDQKHYFVFTDDEKIENTLTVTKIYKKYEGFPLDSLFRFRMFLTIEASLKEYDYIYFFNANMQFVDYVDKELIPNDEENGLVALLHPGLFDKPSYQYPYERNKKSKAYIPFIKGHQYLYFMGSLNGGESNSYLKLINTCSKRVDEDYKDGFIAIFHDESHLNRYLYDLKIKVLSPMYGYPDGWNLSFKPKIIIRDKIAIDPFYRKQSVNIFDRVFRKLKSIYNAITW